MSPVLKIKKHVPSRTIILNRPDKRNALSRLLLSELKQAFGDFHLEKKVRAVILTGAGSAFCAGMDLAEMQETSQQEASAAFAQWHDDAQSYRELLETMLQFPKPIIAAVNGPALAGGAGLVLASDIVVAGHDAKFGLPEPRRGLVAVLEWKGGSAGPQSGLDVQKLPGIVVDDVDATRTGTWLESTSQPGFEDKGSRSVRFEATLPAAGKYEVRLAYTSNPNRATNVPVTIQSADGPTTKLVNQRRSPPIERAWVSLGQFEFPAGKTSVTVSNRNTDGHVIADAVQWLPLKAK